MAEIYLGIDLGTSSVKAILLDEHAAEQASAQISYPINRPRSGWAEQDPEVWWQSTLQAVRTVLKHTVLADNHDRVVGIGLSGQMHGLVLLDTAGHPMRPAIIWSDSRSAPQVQSWPSAIDGRDSESITGFPVATGMLGVSLCWVRDHEPENYARASTVLLPKDYLRYRLTGELATEPTDAGGSLLFDIRAGHFSAETLTAVGLRDDLLPEVIATASIAGTITAPAARESGLPAGTPVAAGGSDQSMAALALGLDNTERAAVAISSGGTVFKRTRKPLDPGLGLHVMPHPLPNQWLAMGVLLSAGLGLDWLARQVFGGSGSPEHLAELLSAAEKIPPGANGLLFSSQIAGTRSPVVDTTRRGALTGLGFEHGQAHLTRAYVEGACLALDLSLRNMAHAGEEVHELVLSGGGARFALWRQTISDVSGLPVRLSRDLEHSALGAARTAAIALGHTIDFHFEERLGDTVVPNPAAQDAYQRLRENLHETETALFTRKDSRA